MISTARTPARIMLVDDSVIVRSLMARILRDSPSVDIVATAGNGQEAISAVRTEKPDIVILDHEMPVMDGLTAIPHILQAHPAVKIILCSALSEKGADITLRGLALGASDFILKPSALSGADNKDRFRDELLSRIHSIVGAQALSPVNNNAAAERQTVTLRPAPSQIAPSIIAIGSSTGGPNALLSLFAHLRRPAIPIVIVQHMPRTFTRILADQLAKAGQIPCFEGEDRMEIRAGTAYIAPGDFHMQIIQDKERRLIALNSHPPENFCRPAVDPLLRSLVPLYGARVLTLILTGMGQDGLEGCRALAAVNAPVFAQDEKSSVVWGMPGAVARAGLCTEVAPVSALAERINRMMIF